MSDKKDEIIKQANNTLQNTTNKPINIEEFVEELIENPNIARNAHQYLLDAIEYYGTRKIFERGEEKDRYIFFDDPENDGEHAIFGNTTVLNEFVKDIRVIVNSEERMQKIILFDGPTATGKSELKRCLINGLHEYSKTEEGKRYTFDWNISSMKSSTGGLTYGNNNTVDESEWFKSPIQGNPLSVLPYEVRQKINEDIGTTIPYDIDLDPFSKEAYDILKSHYEQQGTDNLFTKITNKNHFRIRRYTIDETQGIGVLNVEDDGSIKERLIGSWMPSMFQVLDSRGRKNPQAFSYDGVLSQGNNGLTIIEDATRHADILVHLLNIPDEGYAKIDKKIGFDVDTVPIFISNPDLMEKKINNINNKSGNIPLHEIHSYDSMKAIKRRLFKYNIKYLTNLTDESNLIRKELTGNNSENHAEIRDSLIENNTELAPHVIESIAMYNIITRYVEPNIDSLDLIDKALLLDRGYTEKENERLSIDKFDDFDVNEKDGTFGIPVTYVRDIIRSLLYENNEDVYLPSEVLKEITDKLVDAPIFNYKEVEEFNKKVEIVKTYIKEQQEKDIINAILYHRKASEESVSKYIDNVYAWDEDDKQEYDELFLKEFEKKHFGTTDTDYGGNIPGDEVIELRKSKLIKPLNKYLWKQRNAGYKIEDISLSNAPVISSLIGSYDWEDVFIQHENLDPNNWDKPSKNTETETIKQDCIDILVDEFGYTRKSATRTSDIVFKNNITKIQNVKARVVN